MVMVGEGRDVNWEIDVRVSREGGVEVVVAKAGKMAAVALYLVHTPKE